MLDLLPSEWEVLTMIDGALDLRAIASRLARTEFDLAKVVYGLVSTGVVDVGSACVRGGARRRARIDARDSDARGRGHGDARAVGSRGYDADGAAAVSSVPAGPRRDRATRAVADRRPPAARGKTTTAADRRRPRRSRTRIPVPVARRFRQRGGVVGARGYSRIRKT